MKHASYIRSFNEIYADLTAEELIILYKWVQAEDSKLIAEFAAYNDCDIPGTGKRAVSNNISHKYNTGINLK